MAQRSHVLKIDGKGGVTFVMKKGHKKQHKCYGRYKISAKISTDGKHMKNTQDCRGKKVKGHGWKSLALVGKATMDPSINKWSANA